MTVATATHLDVLEAEAVHIIREVAAEPERPVLDTGHNFPGVIAFRDRQVPDVLVASVQESIARGRVRDEPSRNRSQTTTGAVRSQASSLDAEIAATRISERGETRADDRTSEAAMEDRKRVGYL